MRGDILKLAPEHQRILKRFRSIKSGIAAVFRPRNLAIAFKSVTKGFREYLCFFVALFVLQTGFITFALMTDTNIHNAYHTVTSVYDHHMEITGLDQEQKVNLQYTFDLAITRLDPYIQAVTIHQEVDNTYTFMVTFHDGIDLEAAMIHVLSHDIMGQISLQNTDTGEPWAYRTTPLLTYEQDYASAYKAAYVGILILWTAISVVVLIVLYRIRVNHFKFLYGIYMTCGADFPKLYGTAGGELLAISLLTMFPAILTGFGITALAYMPQGVMCFVSWSSITGFISYNIVAVLLSVGVPMRRMAKKPPIQHLTAGDNTPLVSSPRRSFRMFGSGYPIKYELFGMWRLRKYYIGLVISAVLFASVFVSGFYIADLESTHANIDPYEYTIHYSPITKDEEGNFLYQPIDKETADMIRYDPEIFLDEVLQTPGVSYVDWSIATRGGSLAAHLLITPSQLAGGTDSLVPSDERRADGYYYAFNEFSYTAFDKMYVDMLVSQSLCEFEGDPYALFESERQVIISEDSFNNQAYSFSPGDKVLLAVFKRANGAIDLVVKPDTLLKMQIEKCDFEYIEYTVCAVMRGKASENNITFGITFEEYESLTKTYPVRNELKVYMENGSDYHIVEAAEDNIRSVLQYCSGWQVTPSGHYFKAELDNQKRDDVMIYTLATLVLVVSPLVWFFSQIMYYRKRKQEFEVLLALGAERTSISKIHRLAGGVLSCLAFLATILLSSLVNGVVHILINTLLPKFGLIENVGYDYQLSIPALISCIVVSVLCGWLSCEVPYRIFAANKKSNSYTL